MEGVKSRSIRRPRSGAMLPPLPLMLWQFTQRSVWKSFSPRSASPGTIAAAIPHAARVPAIITRSVVIAGLLTGLLSGQPQASHEQVRPEAFVYVSRLAEAVPSPLGIPL